MNSKYERYLVKSMLLLFIMFLLTCEAFSQDYFYTDKLFGKTFVFTPKETEIGVKFLHGTSGSSMSGVARQYLLSQKTEGLEQLHYGVFSFPKGVSFNAVKEQLLSSNVVAGVTPVFVDQEGYDRYIDPELFTVQFTDHISEKEAEDILSRWGSKIAIKHWTPGYYTVTLPSGMTVFGAVRKFMEWPEVKFTEPATYGFNDLLDDTYLSNQWHLRNTGQESGYTVGSDIKAFPAWDITFGDANIILVIIDTGIDQTHPDLAGNILPRGTEDWDFGNQDSKPLEPDDNVGHGTAVSGIAAAVMNSVGVRGVAPTSRIMPLQIDLRSGWNQNRADAINYAVSRRSDFTRIVISCSWRMSSGDFTAVHSAIQNAVNNNIPIFFAAGNNDTSPIEYPARYPETISVGAMAPCGDLRKSPSTCDGEDYWGSSYGEDLDIAAPGVKIYTTDIQGTGGYNPYNTQSGELSDQNYTRFFNGTSSACPQVAAVAALMLSANSSMTVSEMRTILHNSADKVGGYNYNWNASKPGHSQELGYGRINAYKALKYTLENYGGTLTQSFTIPSGETWNLSAGITLKFASGVSFTSNGVLNANGTSTSRITFDRSGTSGTWGGITFNGGTGSIKYAHISHADKGIFYQCGGPNLIEHTEIDFCNYGIYQPQCSGSDDKNFNNNFVHNNYVGFWFDNIWDPDLFDNHIYNNAYGVYSFGGDADPDLHQNTFENNSSAGLFVYDGGWAYLNNNGQNVLSGNWVGVDCRQYAGASLGTSSSPGYNKFSNNDDYDVWASSSCPDIYAIMNCWLTGVNVWHEGSGQIYTTPSWNCSGLGKAAVAVSPVSGAGGAEITGSTPNDDPVALEHDRHGQAFMAEEKYQEALKEFQFVLENYPTAEVAKTSLHLLYRCYKKSGKRQEGLAYIGLIAGKREAIELGGHAAKLIVYQLVRERRYQEALGMIEKIRSRFPNTELEEVLLYREGVIYRSFVNDSSKAKEVFGELVGRYPDGRLADFGRLELGVSPKGLRKEAEPKTEKISKSFLPQAFVLQQNYPDPFNPVTTIAYHITRPGKVSLKVFDLLGREVATLVNAEQAEGIYTQRFDASHLSSGIYFYRLLAPGVNETRKMLIAK